MSRRLIRHRMRKVKKPNIKLKYPSANSLVVFEVVSRRLNFTRASEELKTTRVAVSSQIKQLENQLGEPLFVRHHRGLRLTVAGDALAKAVAPAFQSISSALDRFADTSSALQLTISASHGMSSHWLMPRIHRFRSQHPAVDFRFQITDTYSNLEADGVDVALRYGDGPWNNTKSKRLGRVLRFPVCSPRYLETAGRLDTPDDLASHTLLFLSGHYGKLTRWDAWLAKIGHGSVQTKPGLTFDDHNSLIEAVLAGEGIALAGPPQITEYLERGLLVRVLEPHATLQRHFWSVMPKNRAPKAITIAFAKWLESEMTSSLSAYDGDIDTQ